jgi:hypothetical protein
LLETRGGIHEGGGGGEYARKDLSAQKLEAKLEDALNGGDEVVEYHARQETRGEDGGVVVQTGGGGDETRSE